MDRAELRRLAEKASNLFPDKWEENDEEVVSGGLTISCVNGPYCDPHIGAKSIAKYQAFASPGNIIELLDRLEAAEKVCRAVEAISNASEIYNPMLVDALKEWQVVK